MREVDRAYPTLSPGGCQAALGHHSRARKAQSKAWDSQRWFRGPRACNKAEAVWFSGSRTSRLHWELW